MTILKIRATITLSLLSFIPAMAQMDNVIDVEHVYKPEIKDANKISIQPEVKTTTVNRSPVDYDLTPITVNNYTFTPVWAVKGDDTYKSAPRRFVTLGGGNEGNILARGAADFELNDKNLFDIYLGLQGHNASVEHLDRSKDWNSRFYSSTASASYEHKITSASSVLVNAGFESQVFNYQQNDYLDYTTDKQHNTLANVSALLTPLRIGQFTISAGAGYELFNQKYLTSLSSKYTEGFIHANTDAAYSLNDGNSLGLALSLTNATYSKGIDGYTLAAVRPHYRWHNDKMNLRAGLYIGTLGVAPDISFTYGMTPSFDIYVDVTGGEANQNTFRAIANANPYWALMTDGSKIEMSPQFNQLSTRAGLRIAPLEGLRVDANIGYEHSKDRMEFAQPFTLDSQPNFYAPIILADGYRFFLNANISYDYKNSLSVTLANQFNAWGIDDNDIATEDVLWRPIIDLDWTAAIRIIGGLRASADFRLQTFKEAKGDAYSRPATTNLGATLSYTLDRLPLTIYIKGNNLLNQKYDNYFGYKAPGINVLAGAAFTF